MSGAPGMSGALRPRLGSLIFSDGARWIPGAASLPRIVLERPKDAAGPDEVPCASATQEKPRKKKGRMAPPLLLYGDHGPPDAGYCPSPPARVAFPAGSAPFAIFPPCAFR